ncbi:unnamed protein product, partial [Nesidiocoris tenuis]
MGSKCRIFCCCFIFLNLIFPNVVVGRRKYSRQDLLKLREEAREMFNHAYTGYLKYAYPYDELRPLTCDGIDTWGSYSLTLIDALDTLAVMGNYSEFRRVVNIITANANFDANINVSVFETNIRIVGGLLSAHLLSQRAGVELEPGWPCNGPLLRLAEDVAKRLLPAFATRTGMPYGTVNLRNGVPPGETTVTCTAGVGTYILEFATLSRLTGDPIYEEVAMHALKVMYEHRSSIGLFGNHIDIKTGKWVARDSGIGAGVDSFFEYLVKGSILLNRPELMAMFNEVRKPIDKYLKKNNWYIWASMHKGQVTLPVFQSLEAYWPGVLTLIGDVETALRSMHNYNSVWKQYGFTPEFYNIPQGQAGSNRESYPLRPELVESAMYLYRATGDPFMLDIGKNILRSIQHSAKTPCGFATIRDARDHTQENRMESFFLAETTKYLYLLFDPDNFIHNRGTHGRVHTLSSGKQCILDSGAYVFNTEAHPIDASALQCCHDWKQERYFSYSSFDYRGEIVSEKLARTRAAEETGQKVNDTEEEQEIEDDYDNEKPGGAENYDYADDDAVGVGQVVEVTRDGWRIEPSNDRRPDDAKAQGESTINDVDGGKVVHNFDGGKAAQNVEDDSSEKNSSNVDELLKIINTNHEKLVNVVDDLLQLADDSKKDEPTFSPSEEPKIENTSFDNLPATEAVDGSVVTKNRVGEVFDSSAKSDLVSLSDYIKTLVVSPPPPKFKFDPQNLLESVRSAAKLLNSSSADRYDMLTCDAQPFLIRITIAGIRAARCASTSFAHFIGQFQKNINMLQ